MKLILNLCLLALLSVAVVSCQKEGLKKEDAKDESKPARSSHNLPVDPYNRMINIQKSFKFNNPFYVKHTRLELNEESLKTQKVEYSFNSIWTYLLECLRMVNKFPLKS